MLSSLYIFTLQIELNAQSQPGNSKGIVRLFEIAAEPQFMFKFTWDSEWSKKLKGRRKVKFFQKFENHCFKWNV